MLRGLSWAGSNGHRPTHTDNISGVENNWFTRGMTNVLFFSVLMVRLPAAGQRSFSTWAQGQGPAPRIHPMIQTPSHLDLPEDGAFFMGSQYQFPLLSSALSNLHYSDCASLFQGYSVRVAQCALVHGKCLFSALGSCGSGL